MRASQRPVELSIVICSHNGERVLPGALRSVLRQSLSAGRFEVIVVDDGSSDRTAAVARAAGATVVRLSPNRGLAGARNAGVSAARAPIVAFTDDDCDPNSDWLAAIVAAFADPNVDVVGGRLVPGPGGTFNQRYLLRRNPLVPLGADLLRSHRPLDRLVMYLKRIVRGPPAIVGGDGLYSVVGANMAWRRELIARLGGFDEAFRFGGEEEDLCRRAHDLQAGIVYAPSATVVHHFGPGLTDTLRRSRAYGRGNARLALKHASVRPIVYPAPLLVLGALASGLIGRRWGLAALGLLAPLATYPRWTVDARSTGSPEPLAYPYVELAQETLTMIGELDGWRAGYVEIEAEQLAPT